MPSSKREFLWINSRSAESRVGKRAASEAVMDWGEAMASASVFDSDWSSRRMGSRVAAGVDGRRDGDRFPGRAQHLGARLASWLVREAACTASQHIERWLLFAAAQL